MRSGLRLALCQMNATVGDLAGNGARIRQGIEAAKGAGAGLALFPELALTGYPPEDLLLREHFLSDTGAQLRELAGVAEGIVAIVGFPERAEGGVYNSAAVLAGGTVHAVYRKMHLPNYGVFDEQRYFKAGTGGLAIDLDRLLAGIEEDPAGEGDRIERGSGVVLGVTVCEDLWVEGPPASDEACAGARLIVNVSASPYHAGKGLERERLFAERARETGAYVAFCAMVGGQDELVFDGHSFVLDPHGETIARAAQFEEDLLVCELALAPSESGPASSSPGAPQGPLRAPIPTLEQEVYEALLLGLHDYVHKNGFGGVVLGLSGGIDSALVACLAVDALGAERVNVAIMPSPYSSSATQTDARALAQALDVRAHELRIEPAMEAYGQTLRADFEGLEEDLTEENLQARIRGNLLMALSNKFGWLVLTTGNKSEMSVGYTTLYGDLAGGFAVIKDVPKTLVYRLSRWRNTQAATVGGRVSAPIPDSIIERAPSAELRAEQTDQDSLPPYDVLDRILYGYIELDHSREQLIAEGLPARDVEIATRLVDRAEYKRRQAPPGIKITERAFGRDRRMPITNAYRG
ncbi:MAG TPA: NAD+ synthase [Solirubrobacteraceae bacterium]|jgi:NAD+ synthase (glutamine-hydrolysing)|nr:NAD+ synthase [Solirubrobacteraceae bacterium]